MANTIEVGPIRAEAGSRAFGTLPVATLPNGAPLGIGVHWWRGPNRCLDWGWWWAFTGMT